MSYLFKGAKIVAPVIVPDTQVQAAAVASLVATIPAAAPAGGTGAAAGGWDTAGNRDTAITLINDLRTFNIEIRAKLDAIILALRGAGIIIT